jgi:CubicO group peptidase (beta-lactamase class C family)
MTPARPSIDRTPLDELVDSFAAEHHCPTVSWGVVRDGELALTGGVGDVTEHTVYRIASMTKSFSAAATLILRDEGVLRLDDPVASHAPELGGLRCPTDDAAPITVRDVLAMTSGLVTDDPWADRHLDLTDDEFDRIIADGCVFAGTTGASYEYSNFGYAVLGRVVHRAAGSRIQQIVTDRLLGPLGLAATTWVQPDHDDWARPMRWLDDRLVDDVPLLGDGLIAPMGGIWSNVSDISRWVAWLDEAFPARDGADPAPLRRGSRREMQSPQDYVGLRLLRGVRVPTCYGYGLRILDEPELGRVVTHSGGFPGYGSNMRWMPGRGLGVIALANVTYAPMTELTARLLDLLHEQGVVPPAIWPMNTEIEHAALSLIELLNGWSDAAADDLFADNVAEDDSHARRGADAARHRPLAIESIHPINDARARIRCTDVAGAAVTVTFALAPLRPITIQDYEITPAR